MQYNGICCAGNAFAAARPIGLRPFPQSAPRAQRQPKHKDRAVHRQSFAGHWDWHLFVWEGFKHLKPEDYGWALEETEATMRRMAELTGVQYPVDRLTVGLH
jgi:hypothetical protein